MKMIECSLHFKDETNLPIDVDYMTFSDGEPCKHKGCLSHVSHPCEVCGRIAGKGEKSVLELRGEIW